MKTISSNTNKNEKETKEDGIGLLKEHCWLQKQNTLHIFKELELLLRESCKKLNVSNKVEDQTSNPRPTPSQTEKFTLIPRSGQDTLKATVTLLGENIVNTEINLKYAKVPGGVFRSSANPDVQWKLQQLQDASNHCTKALQLIIKGAKRYELAVKNNGYSVMSGDLLISILDSVKESLKAALNEITKPKRKSLLELCNFQPIKSFNPPLPSDILLSYYVSSTKIVCAAYQAECKLTNLVDVLHLLNSAFSSIHTAVSNLSMLKSHSNVLNYSNSK